jgi:hypothetical protein
MRHSVVVLVLLIAGCSYQPIPPHDRWHQLAAESDRLTSTFRGRLWEQKMIPMHNAFWPQVTAACGPQAKAAGITSFQAIAVISHSGVVTEYLLNPASPALQCFSKQMVGRKYPSPPELPFYELYSVNLGF